MQRLTESLLVIARTGAERDVARLPVALDIVAKKAASWLEAETQRRGIRLTITTGDLRVDGDVLALERLVRNLLDNAVRHSPDGGAVGVHATQESSNVVLSVTDEGPASPPPSASACSNPSTAPPTSAAATEAAD